MQVRSVLVPAELPGADLKGCVSKHSLSSNASLPSVQSCPRLRERRVASWAVSFERLLQDPLGVRYFSVSSAAPPRGNGWGGGRRGGGPARVRCGGDQAQAAGALCVRGRRACLSWPWVSRGEVLIHPWFVWKVKIRGQEWREAGPETSDLSAWVSLDWPRLS